MNMLVFSFYDPANPLIILYVFVRELFPLNLIIIAILNTIANVERNEWGQDFWYL